MPRYINSARVCPPALIAANGMDALTQLLESYVSTKTNPMTGALALSGLRAVRDGLIAWYEGGASAAEASANMAYASLLSGICLAQTGLGSMHGLASPLGAFFPIPHGVDADQVAAQNQKLKRLIPNNLMTELRPFALAVDTARRVVRINETARHLLGVSSPIPFPVDTLPADVAFRAALDASLSGERTDDAEILIGERTVNVTARPLAGGGAVVAL